MTHEAPPTFALPLKEDGDPPRLERFFYSDHLTDVARIARTIELVRLLYADQLANWSLLVNTEEFARRTRELVIAVGRLDYERKRFNMAAAMFEKALRVAADDPVSSCYLAKTALETGSGPDAVDHGMAHLRHAVRADAAYDPAYRVLGLAHYRKGEGKQAVAALERCLALNVMRGDPEMRRYSCAVLMIIAAVASAYGGDTLEEYAQKRDQAIGVTVPDFNCDSGTLVPTTHFANGKCDRPNVLNSMCDPGSRSQVLTNNPDAYVVAHCRKIGHKEFDGLYSDIAVIQHNRKNGATCFYQSPAQELGNLDGRVKAPSKGTSAWPWPTPAETARIGCAGCHDNGPLIRSPYLTQITGPNKLPGAGDSSFNRHELYFFVGEDFASWKAYKPRFKGLG